MAVVSRSIGKPGGIKAFLGRYGLLIAFVMLVAFFSLASDRFLRTDNLLNILRQSAINGIISVGMMIVILTRGIDLSVGAVLALSSVFAAKAMQAESSATDAILTALVVGAGCGLINGVVVAFGRIPAFIATLGMMTAARGVALSISEGRPISGFPDAFRQLGTSFIGPIPTPVIIAAAVFVAGYFLLYHTPLGRQIFALGDNEQAAYLSGLATRRITIFVYALSGALAALAGVILIGRLNSTQPTAGMGYEFDAIAAVVVGGTSFSGGEGNLIGTLLGVLLIGVLATGLNILNVPAAYEGVVQGVVIAAALLLYRLAR